MRQDRQMLRLRLSSIFPRQSLPERSLTFAQRAHLYRREMFSLDTIVGPASGAGVGQWEDELPDWHQGAEGLKDMGSVSDPG